MTSPYVSDGILVAVRIGQLRFIVSREHVSLSLGANRWFVGGGFYWHTRQAFADWGDRTWLSRPKPRRGPID